VSELGPQLEAVKRALLILPTAAILGAAMGFIRPVRRGIVPRSSHVVQTQVLLAVVGALIILIVAESLARAFAIVGAAGLVRYRARIEDPKDAGVLLVALTIGLITGTGLLALAGVACAFVIAVLWLLESLEPVDRTQFDLTVETKDAMKVRPQVEHALRRKGVRFELWGSSATQLRYEVTVPFNERIIKLTKTIRSLDKREGIVVDWQLKRPKVVQT
jgi:uncharacterized membrane protein YhiD involved in acid resistance